METIAIVVLGASNDENGVLSSIAKERCDQAIAEFRQHPGARIIPTGGWGSHFNTTDRPHGQYLREYLAAHGIPSETILECVESSTTIEDAKLCRPLVKRYSFRKLIVVTSDFHVARAQYLFTEEFADLEVEFSSSMTRLPIEELQKKIAHEQNALAKLKPSLRP